LSAFLFYSALLFFLSFLLSSVIFPLCSAPHFCDSFLGVFFALLCSALLFFSLDFLLCSALPCSATLLILSYFVCLCFLRYFAICCLTVLTHPHSQLNSFFSSSILLKFYKVSQEKEMEALEATIENAEISMLYLRNCVFKYMSSDDKSEQEKLYPVIATILKLSREEQKQVESAMNIKTTKSANGLDSLSSDFVGLSTTVQDIWNSFSAKPS
jgi:hypothetical protein